MDGKYTQQIKCKQNKKMRYLDLLLLRYPMLACCRTDIIAAFEVLTGCYVSQGKMLVCGNGGSAADAEHIVGELMKGFKKLFSGRRSFSVYFPKDMLFSFFFCGDKV